MALICKVCGYKQHDEETIRYYKKKYPGLSQQDIPYVCYACMDDGYKEVENSDALKTVEVYYSDLIPEAQKRLLDGYGLSDPREANWDVFPVLVLYPEIDEPEDFDE